jgi:Ser/Thr protein kinase RdoA (MazF antagonist)
VDESELTVGLTEVLVEQWAVVPDELRRVGGPVGMGSVVVEVDLPDAGAFVAKWVPTREAAALDAGSAVALELSRDGLSTGAPRPTRNGLLSAPLADGRIALLQRVPGSPISGASEDDQQRMAATLTAVHSARPVRRREDAYLAASLRQAQAVEPWVVPAVRAALDEYARLPPLWWGLVHHDPAPEAFFYDPASDVTSLIDWTGAGEGPILFDVASALMYLGGAEAGRPFLEAYLDLAADEVRSEAAAQLAAMWRFRGAVQAAYFSRRIAQGDLTGIDDPAENLHGLDHARRMLLESERLRSLPL